MRGLFVFFSVFLMQCHASLLVDFLEEFETNHSSKIKAFGLNFSSKNNFTFLSSELMNYSIDLETINCVHERRLPLELKKKYCSRNVSSYLLAQIFSNLHVYHHCISHNYPHALILEKNAFIFDSPNKLEALIKEANTHCPKWDIIFTDVHYHMPKDGALAIPQVVRNGKVIPQNKRLSKNLLRVNSRYGTVSYLISLRGMKKILNFYARSWLDLPFDQALFQIPGLKILSSSKDIITNAHRCPKYDQLQQRRIKNDVDTIREENVTKSFSLGTYQISPSSLLLAQNWNLIYPYISQKFSFLQDRCHWISALNDNLPSFDDNGDVLLDTCGKILSGIRAVGKALEKNSPLIAHVVEEACSQFSPFPLNRATSLSEEQKDFVAREYIRLFPNHYIVCIFPAALGMDETTEEILSLHGNIIYKKTIKMSESGSLEFIKLLYEGEGWVGTHENQYKFGRVKASNCFPKDVLSQSPLRVYLYANSSLEQIREVKKKIRELYQCGNDSVHIHDTKSEAKRIADAVFHNESLAFLNRRKGAKTPSFDWLIPQFQLLCVENERIQDSSCIDSSAVLAAYALRDCRDLDVLHDPYVPFFSGEDIDSHNTFLRYYPCSIEEILWNPSNHFYYGGVKFVSLSLVKKMKQARGTHKDLRDVKLIESLRE